MKQIRSSPLLCTEIWQYRHLFKLLFFCISFFVVSSSVKRETTRLCRCTLLKLEMASGFNWFAGPGDWYLKSTACIVCLKRLGHILLQWVSSLLPHIMKALRGTFTLAAEDVTALCRSPSTQEEGLHIKPFEGPVETDNALCYFT